MAQLATIAAAVLAICLGADRVADGAGLFMLGALLLAAMLAWGR